MTVLPAFEIAGRAVIPTIEPPSRPRRRGVDLQPAGRVGHRARQIGGIAGAVLDRRAVPRLTAVTARSSGVLPAANRVAEGQRIGAGAAGIGRGAAVVERQRRGAAGNRHRLAQVERQRDHAVARSLRSPLPVPTPPPTTPSAPWCRSAACRPGWSPQPVRLAALPAPSLTVAVPRLTAVTARSAVFWPAANRVAEGQRIGAGAAGIGRGAAVVERQRRGAARNRHRLAQVERQRHHAAGPEIAGAGRDAGAGRHHRRHRRRRGVDLQVPAGLVTAPVTGWRHCRRRP